MDLYNKLILEIPNLTNEDFGVNGEGAICLKDDGDGIVYISKWEYNQPIPEGLILGKPETAYVFESSIIDETPATISEPVVEQPVVTEE